MASYRDKRKHRFRSHVVALSLSAEVQSLTQISCNWKQANATFDYKNAMQKLQQRRRSHMGMLKMIWKGKAGGCKLQAHCS
jgi:hypothetical protein